LTLFLFCLATLGLAQNDFYSSLRPQVLVVVKESSMGPDLVTITAVDAAYSAEDLKPKIAALGQLLGSVPRGVALSQFGETSARGTFAVDGLINPGSPRIRLVELVKAMATGPKPFQTMNLFFENLPQSENLPKRYDPKDGTWTMEGQISTAPAVGIEYRVKVETSDLKQIVLPGPEAAREAIVQARKSGPDFVLLGLILLGSLAAGLLVYFALIRGRGGRRS
jgi:hypothetical protein